MIDERAIIDPAAKIADDVTVGPFSIIDADVEIDSGTTIAPHVIIRGPTRIGKDNQIYQFSSIGEACQDKKYKGERTWLEIGDRNVIREYATMQRGTAQERGVTKVGSDNLFMAYTHVAHDCIVGDHAIFANAASIAGHVEIGDWAILGGFTNIHQFCQVGAHAFTGLGTTLLKDLPPYVVASGNPAKPRGINTEGLKRRGFTAPSIREIRSAYKYLYLSRMKLDDAIIRIDKEMGESADIKSLLAFLRRSERSIVR